MNGGQAATTPSPSANPYTPDLQSVRQGAFVIIQDPQHIADHIKTEWWMGQIIWSVGGASDNRVGALFQVADVDDGTVHWVNAEAVTHVLHALDGIGDQQRCGFLFRL